MRLPGTYISSTETGFYYLQSRYYDPVTHRFINADSFASTGQGIAGTNMFAYCNNNPVIYSDTTGHWLDFAWDAVSLLWGIADVVQNPDDVTAWVGLALDVVDVFVPCVSGLGESARATRTTANIVSSADDVYDTAKAIDKAEDLADVSAVGKTTIKYGDEIKLPNQAKTSEATKLWDEFLGSQQTSYNRFSEKHDPSRIFSTDGSKSIRFGNHEMESLGTRKAHFHYELWDYDPLTNTVHVRNIMQRLK